MRDMKRGLMLSKKRIAGRFSPRDKARIAQAAKRVGLEPDQFVREATMLLLDGKLNVSHVVKSKNSRRVRVEK
jgi:hypothetical protein